MGIKQPVGVGGGSRPYEEEQTQERTGVGERKELAHQLWVSTPTPPETASGAPKHLQSYTEHS